MSILRKRWPVWLLAGLGLVPCGCGSQDTDQMAKVARTVAGRFEKATGGATGKVAHGVEAVRAGWDGMALEARVSARLRWDTELAGAAIDVRAAGAVIELKGKVQNLAQRQRAVGLASTTASVERVVDSLVVTDGPQ